jgi:hypothetical protein
VTGILIEGKHSAKFRKKFGDFCFSGLKARPISAQGNALGLLQGPWTLPMAGMGRTFGAKTFGIKLLRCHRKAIVLYGSSFQDLRAERCSMSDSEFG